MIRLGVNVDHVATLRQARGIKEPDPITAALLAELAGADGITVHLREDRRHIQERDVRLLREVIKTRLNLEMAANEEIINIALQIKPDSATIVPEKRQELTTEGGLDVIAHFEHIEDTVEKLRNKGIIVSLFVDPEPEQIKAAAKAQADFIEIHTGTYAEATEEKQIKEELNKIIQGAKLARELGLRVNAGHGLNYRNVRLIAQIEEIEELNIGHSIISRAIMVGITQAVKEMKILLEQADYLNQKV